MKKIVKRRRSFRVNNPLAFGVLCAMILILLTGVTYALVAGVITPAVRAYQVSNATPSPSPTVAPVTETPVVASVETPTPAPLDGEEATPTPSAAAGKLAGRIIGIDPARGYTSTVRGVTTKVYANRLNYAVATLVKQQLEDMGAQVIFTLTDVKGTMESTERADKLNNGNPELAIRIECNSVGAKDTRGAMAWIPKTHNQQSACKKLADALLNAYCEETGLPKREIGGESVIVKTDETFLNKTKAPVCTLIMGHISNSDEDTLLNDAAFQEKMANGIVDGILFYFGIA